MRVSSTRKNGRYSIVAWMLAIWVGLVLLYVVAFSTLMHDELPMFSLMLGSSSSVDIVEVVQEKEVDGKAVDEAYVDAEVERLLSEVDGPMGKPQLPKETKYPSLLEAPDSSYPPFQDLLEVRYLDLLTATCKHFSHFFWPRSIGCEQLEPGFPRPS